MTVVELFRLAQGDQPDISITIESVADGVTSPSMALSSISKSVTSNSFTTILINFNDLPGNGGVLVSNKDSFWLETLANVMSTKADQNWDRLNFQAGANGATVGFYNNTSRTNVLTTKPAVPYGQYAFCPNHRYRTRISEC
jgi:hypothetical protein